MSVRTSEICNEWKYIEGHGWWYRYNLWGSWYRTSLENIIGYYV